MARIRTIKPGFFRHADLFDAERRTGLPLRVAFAGLWTAADRSGRFAWRPLELKLDCLPYDAVDFADVLDALEASGFIVRYMVDGKVFGCIPSWEKHQVVNHREAQSTIPPMPSDLGEPVHASGETLQCLGMPGHARGEGKGREQEGKGTGREQEGNTLRVAAAGNGAVTPRNASVMVEPEPPRYDLTFAAFRDAYPAARRKGGVMAQQDYVMQARLAGGPDALLAALENHKRSAQWRAGRIPGMDVWLREERWRQSLPESEDQPQNKTISAAESLLKKLASGEVVVPALPGRVGR